MLTDEFWPTLKRIMLEQGIYNKRHCRKIVEGILYRMRTGWSYPKKRTLQ